MALSKVLFSRKKQDWQTPLDFYEKLDKEFNFKCDPCTTADNPLKCEVFYTEKENGLEQAWKNPTFCNPPYDNIKQWCLKANCEQYKGVTTVMLVPARTGTVWFHVYVYDRYNNRFYENVTIRFLKGRLKFKNSNNSAPFDSMLIIFRAFQHSRT